MIQGKASKTNPRQRLYRVANRLEHSSHLAFAPFVDTNLDLGYVGTTHLPAQTQLGRGSYPIFEFNTTLQVLQCGRRRNTFYQNFVALFDFKARVREAKGKFAIVRQ